MATGLRSLMLNFSGDMSRPQIIYLKKHLINCKRKTIQFPGGSKENIPRVARSWGRSLLPPPRTRSLQRPCPTFALARQRPPGTLPLCRRRPPACVAPLRRTLLLRRAHNASPQLLFTLVLSSHVSCRQARHLTPIAAAGKLCAGPRPMCTGVATMVV